MSTLRLIFLELLVGCFFFTTTAQELTQATFPIAKDSYIQDNSIMATLQQQQRVEQVIVEYIWDEAQNALYIYTLDKQEGLSVEKVALAAGFKGQLAELRKMLTSLYLATDENRERYTRLSYEVYEQLVKPIEKRIAHKTALHIICDEPLAYFPFEVLVYENNPARYPDMAYLLKKYVFSYSYLAGGSKGNNSLRTIALPTDCTSIPLPTEAEQANNQPMQSTLVRLWNMRDNTVETFVNQLKSPEKKDGCYRAALQETKLNFLTQPETAVPNYWGGLILVRHL